MNTINAQKQLTDRELVIFNAELDRNRKSITTTYLLYLFFGSIGVHKFYMGKPIMGIVYNILLFIGLFLTLGGFAVASDPAVVAEGSNPVLGAGILSLGLLVIMMGMDLFTIPGQIRKQEERIRKDLLKELDNN